MHLRVKGYLYNSGLLIYKLQIFSFLHKKSNYYACTQPVVLALHVCLDLNSLKHKNYIFKYLFFFTNYRKMM